MARLTDRRRAAALKEIIDRMESGGFEVAKENKIYIKLAEYENADEDFEKSLKMRNATLYECDPEKNTECKKTACYIYGRECRLTTNAKYAKKDKNGNPLKER